MNKELEKDTFDYGAAYHTKRDVRIIKKDGSLEKFNVQKVINAVGIQSTDKLYPRGEEQNLSACSGQD